MRIHTITAASKKPKIQMPHLPGSGTRGLCIGCASCSGGGVGEDVPGQIVEKSSVHWFSETASDVADKVVRIASGLQSKVKG